MQCKLWERLSHCYILSKDTKQTSEVQLCCYSSTSLFSRIGQWTGPHSYCTQTERERGRHTCTCGAYNPVLPWRLGLRQQVGQPLNLTSCLLCCLCIYFSPQLNSLNPKSPSASSTRHAPPLPSRPPAQLLPPANKGGQIQYGSGEGGKRKETEVGKGEGGKERTRGDNGKNKRKKKSLKCLSHLFFPSFSSSMALSRVSSCSACKSFSCTAAGPASFGRRPTLDSAVPLQGREGGGWAGEWGGWVVGGGGVRGGVVKYSHS